MTNLLPAERAFLPAFISHWAGMIRLSTPVFLRLIPQYVLITIIASVVSVFVLLVLGKAAFHLTCMFSPLIYVVIGMAVAKVDPSERKAFSPRAWLPVATRFWKYATPMALVIGLTLNMIILVSLFLADIGAWRSGALPNLNFPVDLFAPERRALFLILLTTSVEQQLLFMPLFVVLGGRLEPHLVCRVLGGTLTLDQAKEEQEQLTKRQKLFLGPMRILVLLGVSLQFAAKELDATKSISGPILLLTSYLGWLFYACLLANLSKQSLSSGQ